MGPTIRTYQDAPSNPFLLILAHAYVGNESRSTAATPPVDFEVLTLSVDLEGQPLPINTSTRGRSHDAEQPWTSQAVATVELPEEWEGHSLTIRWHVQVVDLATREKVGPPWEDKRVIKLDGPVQGGARRQDGKAPPDISRM